MDVVKEDKMRVGVTEEDADPSICCGNTVSVYCTVNLPHQTATAGLNQL